MSTESPFSFTMKVGKNNDLLTGRADTVGEMAIKIQELRQLAAILDDGTTAVQNPVQVAQQNLTNAGIGYTVVEGGAGAATAPAAAAPAAGTPIETINDKWGNEWTYGHPDAPNLPDGRGKYARKRGTSQAGKAYTGWFDPAKGPKPFPKGAVEAETIWPSR